MKPTSGADPFSLEKILSLHSVGLAIMSSHYEEARRAIRELGFRPKKRLGQHFLLGDFAFEAIFRLLSLDRGDEVLEIGPGMGFLTRRLIQGAQRVWAVEVDPLLVGWLQGGSFGSHPALHLIQGDFLKVDLGSFLPDRPVKVVGNLPYSVSIPILFRLFEERERFSVLVVMVQREVAERMVASPGTKSYGTLSVWCQVFGQVSDRVSVSARAFFPRPKVSSTILKMSFHSQPRVAPKHLPEFRRVLRAAFGQRRKTLGNALGGIARPRR